MSERLQVANVLYSFSTQYHLQQLKQSLIQWCRSTIVVYSNDFSSFHHDVYVGQTFATPQFIFLCTRTISIKNKMVDGGKMVDTTSVPPIDIIDNLQVNEIIMFLLCTEAILFSVNQVPS